MNAVNLVGRITKDIELRKTPSGMSFARFTLAVNRRYKKDQGPDADFISCVAWDKRADTMYQYLSKGSLIGIEGRIQTGSYERDGQRVYTTDVVVENFDFLETRAEKQEYRVPVEETEPELNINSSDLPF